MNELNDTSEAFIRINKSEKVILWGASSSGLRVLSNIAFYQKIDNENLFFYDSNPTKWGTKIQGIRVLSEDEFLFIMNNENALCVVTSSVLNQIEKQLSTYGINNWIYSHGLIYTDKIFDKFGEHFCSIFQTIKDKTNLDADELFTLYESAKLLKGLEGDYAEVGVYRGGSACMVSHQFKDKRIFLFDTFEGLPDDKSQQITDEPLAGWLNDTSVNSVISLISRAGVKKENIVICKGYFPDETAHFVSDDCTFCLVHLDTDRYESTAQGLRFFYPRLVDGGRIIIHDYNCIGTPGVKKAVDEFLDEFSLRFRFVTTCESQGLLLRF